MSKLNFFGVVIPTLGERPDFLAKCIESLSKAGCKNIYVVGPEKIQEFVNKLENPNLSFVIESGKTQVAAINQGISLLPLNVKYVGWLGDDDLISKNCLIKSLEKFESDSSIVATYGKCIYIDEVGREIFRNNSGVWASRFMVLLPNLIPQPGSFYSRKCFLEVGGVDETYPLSFDFELFFKLKKLGKLGFIPEVVSSFRWHRDSLSVDQRHNAVWQTSKIRVNNLPSSLRQISFLWEPIIRQFTYLAGLKLSNKWK